MVTDKVTGMDKAVKNTRAGKNMEVTQVATKAAIKVVDETRPVMPTAEVKGAKRKRKHRFGGDRD